MEQELFNPQFSSVSSSRIFYTPSFFARSSLLHLQEVGTLKALKPHTSKREKLQSYLCFAVEDGEGELVYEEKTYKLKAGDVVFIDCRKPYSHSTGNISNISKKHDGDDHSADIDTLWILCWCHFYGPSLPAIYAKYCERGGEPVIHTTELQNGMVTSAEVDGNTVGITEGSAATAFCGHPVTLSPYTSLLTDIYNIASSSDYIRDMRINEKLNTLLTLFMESSWHQENGSNTTKKMEIQNVKAYLDEHYAEKLSLDAVAANFFIDKSYLTRLFKERYGVTITTYLQQVRITHAKRMLRFTDKRVEEIGLECGIGELNYFSRVFKKLEGVSPSEYRKL